jgi:hypothetical protein
MQRQTEMTTLTAQDVERLAAFCAKQDIVEIGAKTLAKLCTVALRGMEREGEAVLTKDCRVGHGVIRAGCKVSTLIGCAERAQEYYLEHGDFPTPLAVSTEAVTDDARDAARYRALRDHGTRLPRLNDSGASVSFNIGHDWIHEFKPEEFDAAVDALSAAPCVPEPKADTHCAERHGGKAT